MAKIENVVNENDENNKAEEQTNFSQQQEEASKQFGLSKTETEIDTKTREQIEEENQLNARLALLELEEGRRYFKPVVGMHYFLTFNRDQALLVRATPSPKFTRMVKDPNNPDIMRKVPAKQWIHTVTHENGNVQEWTITSADLQKQIIETLQKGFSTVEFWKELTGDKPTDVKYHVNGVR